MNRTTLKALTIATAMLAAPGLTLAAGEYDQNTQETQNQQGMQNDIERSAEQSTAEATEGWRQMKLESVMAADSELSAFKIDTEVKGDKATLKGTVKSEEIKNLAEETALNVEGITSVDNKLEVKGDVAKRK